MGEGGGSKGWGCVGPLGGKGEGFYSIMARIMGAWEEGA